jgi:anaerobic selenocysteine-containing dehydrogenase
MAFKVNRRDFLRFTAGGAAGVAASGVTLQGISTLNTAIAAEEVEVPPGPEAWSLGVCSSCPGGCGLRIRTIGKRAVKIQGNPLHPVNHNGLCPRGLAGLQLLYHPDRLRMPLANVGSRKEPEWKEISWEEAIDQLSARLRTLRENGDPHSFVFLSGHAGHLRHRLLRRFMEAYGSPNYLFTPSGLDSASRGLYLQHGIQEGLAYDLEQTRYLISFGANLLEGWGSPVSTMRAFGRWRSPGAGQRVKMVQVDPRFSPTAARADEWIALRPGTEAALALGLAYVLITEGTYDVQFVNDHTFGFEDWRDTHGRMHMGFRSLVLRDYRLNDVAALTQVPIETILRVAREFGRNRPALAISGQLSSTLPSDPVSAMAVHSLNAMVGSLEVPGGALIRPELPGDSDPDSRREQELPPSVLQSNEVVFPQLDLSHLPQVIRSRTPYPIEALFVHGADPVFTLPNGDEFADSLQQVPLVVSFASFVNDTAAQADFILPEDTDLEKWQEAASPPTFPFLLQSISPPVVERLHNTRDSAEVMLEMAKALGGEVALSLPYASIEEFLRSEVRKIFAARAGYTFTTHLEETWNRMLERSGWWAPTYSTEDELWKEMREKGGWWEPTYYYSEWDRVFNTPSRRFEFYSQRLAEYAARHPEQVQALGWDPDDDRFCLPHQPDLPSPPDDFPLLLIPIEVLPLMGGEGAELPYLQQIAGSYVFEHWDSWLEINPGTAAQYGVQDADRVWVESSRGRVQVRLRLYEGVRPGVVHLPLGYGREHGSEWGRRGANPFRLIETKPDPLAMLPQANQTFVRVYRT